MEYKEFAKYYDELYQGKQYKKEVEFLDKNLSLNKVILDVGCGTGMHASLLEGLGYKVDISDLNKEMLDIASNRVFGDSYHQNMLDLKIDKKYDAIISMFAVINHLKDIKELEKVFLNFKNHLNENGIIIIDLHNPQSSGEKEDYIGKIKRKMKWAYNSEMHIETTEIEFNINNVKYVDHHVFKIFTIKDVKKACRSQGLKVMNVYENYIFNEGKSTSKNLQFIIKKELS